MSTVICEHPMCKYSGPGNMCKKDFIVLRRGTACSEWYDIKSGQPRQIPYYEEEPTDAHIKRQERYWEYPDIEEEDNDTNTTCESSSDQSELPTEPVAVNSTESTEPGDRAD